MLLKKLHWIFKRHPFLYLTRFRLLSKNSDVEGIVDCNYNQLNPKDEIPEYFYEINKRIFKDGKPSTDLELVKQLVIWLKDHIKGGPGLSEPSEKALRTMLAGDGGVCSDIAQVFNNFCVINGILVREWGTTSAPFSKDNGGHSFNEVFCKELDAWVLVDVSWTLLFYGAKEVPLSVIALYQLKRSKAATSYQTFHPSDTVAPATISKNYLNAGVVPFLICNYRNKTYDRYLSYTRPYVPVFVTHFVLYVLQRSYHYRFPLDDYKLIFA